VLSTGKKLFLGLFVYFTSRVVVRSVRLAQTKRFEVN